jgi:hypothetical protein
VLDLTVEKPVPLSEAAKLVPPARRGRKTHISTLVRWILTSVTAPDGTRVRLEAVRLGSRWMTSREALQRFAEQLTPRVGPAGATNCVPRPAVKRRRANERAVAELEELGL